MYFTNGTLLKEKKKGGVLDVFFEKNIEKMSYLH